MNSKLVFNVPPKNWEEYLPLGNGRLGCMVKAHPCNEVLQLNEEGIWSGGPQERLNPDTKKYLEQIRSLVNEGRVLEAQLVLLVCEADIGNVVEQLRDGTLD